jgi:hypothetical protein
VRLLEVGVDPFARVDFDRARSGVQLDHGAVLVRHDLGGAGLLVVARLGLDHLLPLTLDRELVVEARRPRAGRHEGRLRCGDLALGRDHPLRVGDGGVGGDLARLLEGGGRHLLHLAEEDESDGQGDEADEQKQ